MSDENGLVIDFKNEVMQLGGKDVNEILTEAFDNAIQEQSTEEQWKRYQELINEDDG